MAIQPTADSTPSIVLVALIVFTTEEIGHALIRLINRLLARRAAHAVRGYQDADARRPEA